jgi:hypothetical protein
VPDRNLAMAARIESAPVRYPFSFVVAGDSGAWPDPTAEAIYGQLLRQAAELEPVFFATSATSRGRARASATRSTCAASSVCRCRTCA